jgi:CubicO group peptidase (beta-lactamase class C family)
MVARDGVPVFGKGYGKANRETGAVAGADTRFRIASVTKQFTAVAILQLAEKGALRLEDPIGKYVPGLTGGDRITLHQLLSHTSGIFDFTNDEALMKGRDEPRTQTQVVAAFSSRPLLFEPGTKFDYSNSNYFLLGMVIEKVTGHSYAEYMQAHVFGPAGMTRTSAMDTREWPDSAAGYSRRRSTGDHLVPATVADLSRPFAAGSIVSTASDLVRWEQALAGDVLMSAESRKRMNTPVKEGYGYGVVTETFEARELIWHEGGIDGFGAILESVPQEGLVVVVLQNHDARSPDFVADVILKMALTGQKVDPRVEPVAQPMDAATRARFAGEYALDAASERALVAKGATADFIATLKTVAFTVEGERLAYKPSGQDRTELFLAQDGTLFAKAEGFDATFVAQPASGEAQHVTLSQPGKVTKGFTRVAKKDAK